MSGLGHLLDMLLDKGFDALAAIFAVANLDGVTIIAMDLEDFGMTWCNAFGRLLIDPAH